MARLIGWGKIKRHGFTRREVKIRYRTPEWFELTAERAEALGNGELMDVLMRRAVAETLLKAYRERYLRNLPKAAAMERSPRTSVEPATEEDVAPKREALERAHDRWQFETGPKARQSALESLRERARDYQQSIEPKRVGAADWGDLPKTGFREIAVGLLQRYADQHAITTTRSKQGMHFGVGHIPSLDKVETPSANEDLGSPPTDSPNRIMWRHLEFGTGAYSLARGAQRSGSRSLSNRSYSHGDQTPEGGGWMYGRDGRNKPMALYLRGSKPVSALRDPTNKLPYQADSLRFRQVFAETLRNALTIK